MIPIGSAFLKSSISDTELLLNTVALTFILDIDDMMIMFACTEDTHAIIETLPGVEVQKTKDEKKKWYQWLYWIFFQTFVFKGFIIALFMPLFLENYNLSQTQSWPPAFREKVEVGGEGDFGN